MPIPDKDFYSPQAIFSIAAQTNTQIRLAVIPTPCWSCSTQGFAFVLAFLLNQDITDEDPPILAGGFAVVPNLIDNIKSQIAEKRLPLGDIKVREDLDGNPYLSQGCWKCDILWDDHRLLRQAEDLREALIDPNQERGFVELHRYTPIITDPSIFLDDKGFFQSVADRAELDAVLQHALNKKTSSPKIFIGTPTGISIRPLAVENFHNKTSWEQWVENELPILLENWRAIHYAITRDTFLERAPGYLKHRIQMDAVSTRIAFVAEKTFITNSDGDSMSDWINVDHQASMPSDLSSMMQRYEMLAAEFHPTQEQLHAETQPSIIGIFSTDPNLVAAQMANVACLNTIQDRKAYRSAILIGGVGENRTFGFLEEIGNRVKPEIREIFQERVAMQSPQGKPLITFDGNLTTSVYEHLKKLVTRYDYIIFESLVDLVAIPTPFHYQRLFAIFRDLINGTTVQILVGNTESVENLQSIEGAARFNSSISPYLDTQLALIPMSQDYAEKYTVANHDKYVRLFMTTEDEADSHLIRKCWLQKTDTGGLFNAPVNLP